MQIKGTIEIALLSPSGKKTKIKRLKMHSFLKQFIQWISANWAVATRITKNTTGNPANIMYGHYSNLSSSSGVTTFGIIIGTGTNPVAIDDYKIQTIIPHGSEAGKLAYQATIVSDVIVSGNNAYLTVIRNFVNNTPSPITIQETAIYAQIVSIPDFFCFARDLTGGYTVPNAKTAQITYTLKVTV